MRGAGPAGLVHIVCRKHEILLLVPPRKPVAHMRTPVRRPPALRKVKAARPGDDRCVAASHVARGRWCGQAAGVTVRPSTRHTRCTAVPFMLPRAEEARALTEPRSEARQHESHAADGLPTCRAQRAIRANKPHV